MTNYSTNLDDWGATGEKPPSGYKYSEGEPPVDFFDNWLMDNIITDLQHLTDLTSNRIETDKGTAGSEPSSPENSHIYHDQDNERLKVWDVDKAAWRGLIFRDGDTLTGVLDLDTYDLEAAGTTVYDASSGYVPRAQIDDQRITQIETASGTNTSYQTTDDEVVLVDTATNTQAFTVELASADAKKGNFITVVDGGGLAGDYAITLTTEGSETIDGDADTKIDSNDGAVVVVSNGDDWFTAGGGGGGGASGPVIRGEDGVLSGKTLESGDTMEIKSDESFVVSDSYTVDGTLTVNGSMTVM